MVETPSPEQSARTRVTVLCHDLSNNCLGRAHVITRLLRPRFDVEVIGPRTGEQVWLPLRNDPDFPVVDLGRHASLAQIAQRASGDILYPIKPRGGSLGAALRAVRNVPRPMVVDIDDFELGFYRTNLPWAVRSLCPPWKRNGLLSTLSLEFQAPRAGGVTVSTSWLKARYGGMIVPHSRPRSLSQNLRTTESADLRRIYAPSSGDLLLLFLGSIREHKLRVLLSCLDELKNDRIKLLVVGDGDTIAARPYLTQLPPQPFSMLPVFLGAADAVVLAQDGSVVSRAQLPAKIFDAMALGVAVIASDVSDLRSVLGGGGAVFPPSDVAALGTVLQRLLDDRGWLRTLGDSARERFERLYCDEVVGPPLQEYVSDVARHFHAHAA